MLLAAAVLAFAAKPGPKPKPAPLTPEQRAAQDLLKPLNLHDRVAQLVMGVVYADPMPSNSPEFEKWRHWVRDLHIGGLIVNNNVPNGVVRYAEPYAMAVLLNRMQKLAKVPLLVGGDFERAASMRVAGGVRYPYNMAYGAAGDLEASRYEGLATAREARALGVQWIFAPVADVNSNPDNPVINIRSYGEDPDTVSRHVAAYIDGAHSDPNNRVLVTAKHFPGHGDTSIDSHKDLALLDKDRDHIDSIELKPFQAAIARGVDSIMTAHMAVPALEPEGIPATVSPKVLTGLLRNELKFQNIIITDAMDMAGLTKEFRGGEASVRAILAGADVLLMPPDPDQAIRAVVTAVENGRISRQRIDESAMRVLSAKVRVGLPKNKLVNVETLSDVLESKESEEHTQHVSDRAVALLRNEGHAVPLADPNHACVIIAVPSRASTSGPRFIQEFARRGKDARIVTVDGTMSAATLEASFKEAAEAGDTSKCSAIVVSANVASGSLGGQLAPFIQKLTEGPAPVVLIAVGNPYLLASFPKAAAALATFSVTPPSEFSAVKALFGQIAITGHTPVSISGLAAVGDGIQLPARSH